MENELDSNRFHPLTDPVLTLRFTGAHFQGIHPDPFRLYFALPELRYVIGPVWAAQPGQLFYKGPIPRKLTTMEIRHTFEPDGAVFGLGGKYHNLVLNLQTDQYPACGQVLSEPIALRFAEGPIITGHLNTMRLSFEWSLSTRVEDVLQHVMEQTIARSGMYGVRVLARRTHTAQRALHAPPPTPPPHPPPPRPPHQHALPNPKFAYHKRPGGPWDLRLTLSALFGQSALDTTQDLCYPIEPWNAFSYAYLGAAAGFTENEVLAIPELADHFSALEELGLRDVTDHYLQYDGPAWIDILAARPHLSAELLRIGRNLDRQAFSPRPDLAIPNALGFGYDLGRSLNGRKMPAITLLMDLIREAGFPALPFHEC